jgi:hypothetical protein
MTGVAVVNLLPQIKLHFDELEDRLKVFSKHEFQAESWFKGELITFLDAALRRGRIDGFDREVSTHSRSKADIVVDAGGSRHWIELKHWLIGNQRGTAWHAGFYFGDKGAFGLFRDASKLVSMTDSGILWMLVLATVNPGQAEWHEGLDKYHSKFAEPKVVARSWPDSFPASYCLGLFEILRG